VVMVGTDPVEVDRRLLAGELACPCGGGLSPWGHARPRAVRGSGVVRPRRARCLLCRATHVLLTVSCLLRRADPGEVIALRSRRRPLVRGIGRLRPGWVVQSRRCAAGYARSLATPSGCVRCSPRCWSNWTRSQARSRCVGGFLPTPARRSAGALRRPADGSGWWARCRHGSWSRRSAAGDCSPRPARRSGSTRAGPWARVADRRASRLVRPQRAHVSVRRYRHGCWP
jgi:hypothetical protein